MPEVKLRLRRMRPPVENLLCDQLVGAANSAIGHWIPRCSAVVAVVVTGMCLVLSSGRLIEPRQHGDAAIVPDMIYGNFFAIVVMQDQLLVRREFIDTRPTPFDFGALRRLQQYYHDTDNCTTYQCHCTTLSIL